jgi:hypothetical protein
MAPDPMSPISFLGKRIPKRPFMITPKSGKSGTNQTYSIIDVLLVLPLHQIDIIYINGFFIPVESNDNTQSHCCLSGCNRHHKEDKNLAIHGVQMTGKGNQGQISRVEHQFNTHEDNNGVSSDKNPQHPYTKENDT